MSATFDDILGKYVGGFGRYQKLRIPIFSLVELITVLSSMSSVFIADNPKYHCTVPIEKETLNCSRQQLLDHAVPYLLQEEGQLVRDSCHLYDRNFSSAAVTEDDVCSNTELRNASYFYEINKNTSTRLCLSWDYSRAVYESTVVTEWDLVCDRAWLAKNTAGVYMATRIFGTFICGWLADRFGRRKVILLAGFFDSFSFFLSGFVKDYNIFIVCKAVEGFFSLAFGTSLYVLRNEIVTPNRRELVLLMAMVTWSLGFGVLGLIAYFLNQWRQLVVIIGTIKLAVLFLFALITDESPRWLLSRGREEEAYKILSKMASENRKELPDLEKLDWTPEKKEGFISPLCLFKTPGLRWLTMNQLFIWFTVSFVYYGITLNTSDLAGNVFINFLISGATEVPVCIAAYWLPKRFGRIKSAVLSNFGCGVSLLLIMATPKSSVWAVVTIVMFGKFFTSIAFNMAYLTTGEVYSTKIRILAMSTCSAAARVGGTAGVYAGLLKSIHWTLPSIVFAIPSIISALLLLTLPETKGLPLLQTIEECEHFAVTNSKIPCKKKDELTLNPKESSHVSNSDQLVTTNC